MVTARAYCLHNGGVSTPDPAQHSPRTPEPGGDTLLRRYRRLIGALTVTMLASWLCMLLPLPWSLLTGLLGIVALVLLVLMMVVAWRAGRRSSLILGVVFGLPASVMLIGSAAVTLLFYGPSQEYQECMASAVTEQARASCESGVRDSTAAWVSRLLGS